jgi:hypothetical protein
MRRSCMLPILLALVSCSPSRPAPQTGANPVTEPTTAPTPTKDLPESACAEPMYDPNAVAGPKTDVRIEVHDATGEQLALTEFCILLDGRSVFSKAQMKQSIADGGKGTVAWTSPVPTAEKHTVKIMMAMTGAGSAEISKLKLKLRGERTFNAKAGLVIKVETVEEGDAKTPIDTRAALHVSPFDP